MKFQFITIVKNVYDHEPVLGGRKEGNETVFAIGERVKRIVTDENITLEYKGEDAPKKGARLRVTIEEI